MPADADEARRVAEQILSAPEYQEPARPWWDKVLEKVDEFISRIFGTLSGSGGGGSSIIGWVILVLAVAAAVTVVVLAVRSIRRSKRVKVDEGRRAEAPAPPARAACRLAGRSREARGRGPLA